MLGGVIHGFEQALIDDTLHNRLKWSYMDEFTDAFSLNYRNNKNYVPFDGIMENEFFQIDYHRAYVCMSSIGIIYLYFALEMPGSIDPPSQGLRLALHLMPYDPHRYTDLDSSSEYLYQLENAIMQQLSKRYPFHYEDTEQYIRFYLRSHYDLRNGGQPDSADP